MTNKDRPAMYSGAAEQSLEILPDWKVEIFFLESRYSIKARQSKERVSFATKLEQYTCTLNDTRIIGLFYSYHCIIKLVRTSCGLGSPARTVNEIKSTCVRIPRNMSPCIVSLINRSTYIMHVFIINVI